MSDPKLLNASYVNGLVSATGSLSSNISTLQTATGVLRGDIDSNDIEISALQTATGTLRGDIDSNDTDISALQTATGVLSQVSVTGSSSIHASDFTGVGNVTVTLDGSIVKISGESAGGGTPAGSDNQIQFNDGGSFGASSNLTWDDNGLYVNGYISGQEISGSRFIVSKDVDFTVGSQTGALSFFESTGLKTYPSTASFLVSFKGKEIEIGTNQTINSTTPGGYNFLYGEHNRYYKSAGSTGDLGRLYVTANRTYTLWEDKTACQNYIGNIDLFSYFGTGTSLSFNAERVFLWGTETGTQNVATVTSNFLRVSNTSLNSATGATQNITTWRGVAPNFSILNQSSYNDNTINITDASFFTTDSYWNLNVAGTNSTGVITNLYGLRLTSPSVNVGVSVTNNYGISQEWSSAKNYFAGYVGIGTNTPSVALHVEGDITGQAISGTSISAPEITNLQTATGTLRADIDSNDTDISALQAATGVLRGDIDSNDTDISALQTATGVLSQVSVTGSSSIHAPDLTGVGNVTVTLDGSIVKISGASAGGGTPAGSDRQIQFNDGGSFGADSQLFFETSTAAQLFVSGAGGNTATIEVLSSDTQEGGQVTLYGGTSYAGKDWTLDVYQDKFRIFSGALPYLQISDRSLQLLDGTTKVSLNVNGDSYLNGGNIGIGTSSPSRQLHSLSASNNYFKLETDNVNGYAGIEFENDAKTWTLGINNSDDFVLASAASFGGGYPITVKNGAYNNQLYLASAGKIGINNDPQAALDIYSSGQTALDVHTANENYFTCQLFNDTYGTVNTTAHQLLMLNNGTLTWYMPDDGATPGNIQFYSRDTSSYVMTLDADNARVGIGTTAPASNLHVIGAANAELRIESDNALGDPFTHYKLDGGTSFCVGIDDDDANSFKISNNTTLGTNDYVKITTAGLVTLNSAQTVGNFIAGANDGTADGARLEVWTENTQSPFAIINTNNSNYKVLDSAFTSNNVAFSIYNASQAETIKLDVNGDSFFDGGNFAIGTTSPATKLHVVGDITGQAISGTSFHGSHFVSAPYNIGATNGAITIDFNNGSTQYATLNGNVTSFAASNVAAGESVVVQFTTTSARTIAGGSSLAFIGEHPTGLNANMTGILSLMSFDGSSVVAGFAVQTGIG